MIVDCHTHFWERKHLGKQFVEASLRYYPDGRWFDVSRGDYLDAMKNVDKAIIFGLNSTSLQMRVPNEFVADFAREYPNRLIGFMSIDPTDKEAAREIYRCHDELGLRGIKIALGYIIGFDPSDPKFRPVFESAQELRLPIIFHGGPSLTLNTPMKYGRPILLDDLANQFPDLKMVIAHLGHPFEDETIWLIRKHPNLYSDISAMHTRPFRLFLDLVRCAELKVTGKLLFGSDFPFFSPEETIAKLSTLNDFVKNTDLPRVPEDTLRQIIERDTLGVLGL
jgi:predicted TIM-barrel fold metal-dependent hydrolase